MMLTRLLVPIVLAVAATAAHAAPRPDPGFPYVDANCDRAFEPADGDVGRATGVDLLALIQAHGRFATGEALDGYVPPAAPACLVWPASVKLKTRALPSLELIADVHLVLRGGLDMGVGSVTLSAGARLEADGATITAYDDVTLSAGEEDQAAGALTATSAKLRSRHGSVYVSATTAIAAARSDVRALGDIVVYDDSDGPGPIDLERAKLRATAGLVDVFSTFAYEPAPAAPPGDVDVRVSDAKLGGFAVSIVTLGGAILADRARIQGSRDDGVLFDSAGGLVSLDDAHVTRAGSIDVWTWVEPENPLQQTRVRTRGARLRADGTVDIDVGCGGVSEHGPSDLLADGVAVTATDGATLATYSHTDPGFIDVRDARLLVNGGYPSDLLVAIYDDGHESTIDARGAQVRDPVLPTFFAENVLGDPTPNSPDLAFAPNGFALTQLDDTRLRADWTVVNQGPREIAAGTRVRFLRSTDSTLDAGDVVLADVTIATPIPGRSGRATGATELTVPPGELFWIVAVVDPDDAVNELDEGNNVAVARRPLPDLGFAGPLAIVLTSDTEAELTWTVRNFGDLAAPADVVVDFHLSEDAVLDEGDLLLDRVTIDALAPGGSVGATHTFTGLPSEGRFFVLATIDPEHAVLEITESNNRGAAAVGPDLALAHLLVRYSVSGRKFLVTARLQNEGARPAGASTTRLELYPVPPGGQPLALVPFDGLAAGASFETIVEIPYDGGPVTLDPPLPFWLVGALVDADDAVAESDEANNYGTLVNVYWQE